MIGRTTNVLILGTDTDVGKTSLSLLWVSAFADEYDYWKPVETGPADSRTVAELVPDTCVHPAVCSFPLPVAPPLAARQHNTKVPPASAIAAAKPASPRHLLVESFGGPFSPLNDCQLQIDLIKALAMPTLLVCSSALGAVGRALQCCTALAAHGIEPRAVVLMGQPDDFAVATIANYRPERGVLSLRPPVAWTVAAVKLAAAAQAETLRALRDLIEDANGTAGDNLVERDMRSVWHPYSPLRGGDPPLACVGAQDEFLVLNDGQHVIDGISSWWTILHGHRHPPLMQALTEAMARFDHVHFAGVTHAPAVELAERLLASVGFETGRVFYSDDGSTAVEVALKMAYQFWCHQGQPERTRFVGFEHGYHGDTFGAMAVSRDPVFFGRFEPLLLRADILPLDPDKLDEHLSRHGRHTAAVIVEPLVQGAGGMRMHSPQRLRRLWEVARAHDVLFIADEVMTGGGRTGTLWAHQAAGIAPDLVCAGKTLTGGMLPLAATLVSQRVVDIFDTTDRTRTFFHGHSFTAHPLACAVAAANWKLVTSWQTSPAQALENFWQAALAPLAELPRVREVRVRGSIAAVEVRVDDAGYLADVGQRMRRVCLDVGVLLRPLGNVLYALPPLATSEASLKKIVAAMSKAVRQV